MRIINSVFWETAGDETTIFYVESDRINASFGRCRDTLLLKSFGWCGVMCGWFGLGFGIGVIGFIAVMFRARSRWRRRHSGEEVVSGESCVG
jgi:hypothetical protein